METSKKSRKIPVLAAIFILLAGIFIGGYLVLNSGRGSASQLEGILSGNSFAISSCESNPNDPNKDSDYDGLKDWQEIQVYKTDPCKPDSDGDGYLDGEEIASGYDPTKKAPGDELPGTMPKTPRPLPANLTEALRQKLSQQITEDKIRAFNSSGELLSATELENYPGITASIQDIIAGNPASLFAPETIDDSQIKTIPDNSRLAIQNFAAAATAALDIKSEADPQTSQGESEMFLNALENNDFSLLEKRLKDYQDAYEKLKKLTVPSELLPLHKEQLEIISQTIKIYQGIKEINTDPLKANLALQSYELVREQFANWLKNLAEFIKAHP